MSTTKKAGVITAKFNPDEFIAQYGPDKTDDYYDMVATSQYRFPVLKTVTKSPNRTCIILAVFLLLGINSAYKKTSPVLLREWLIKPLIGFMTHGFRFLNFAKT